MTSLSPSLNGEDSEERANLELGSTRILRSQGLLRGRSQKVDTKKEVL